MEIRIFKDNYNRSEFYSIMGKYFAEMPYIKELPYNQNKPTNIWFVALESQTVLGFGAVNVLKNKVVFEHSYVEEAYRNQFLWKTINQERIKFAELLKLPIEVVTKEPHLRDYWLQNEFKLIRKKGQYFILMKELRHGN